MEYGGTPFFVYGLDGSDGSDGLDGFDGLGGLDGLGGMCFYVVLLLPGGFIEGSLLSLF